MNAPQRYASISGNDVMVVEEGGRYVLFDEWNTLHALYEDVAEQVVEVTTANAKLLGKLLRAQQHIEQLIKEKRVNDAVLMESAKTIVELREALHLVTKEGV